uniref:Potassium channel domain-containing protein n=1 Tax=Strigamia maritima TaxID=126957 RepID=T1IPT8_STRMM
MLGPRRGGCFALLHIGEDNARFLLLAVFLIVYLISGAAVFQTLEYENEVRRRQKFWNKYKEFRDFHNGTVDEFLLNDLLYEYGNATSAGILHKRPRWDFAGAFYFVSTVISTIERVITLLAWSMRKFHERELRRRGLLTSQNRRDSQTSLEDYALDQWKPSVYWVIVYLFLGACLIAITASALYCNMENWTYIESLYFCFVSFSTIGFGDYVASQEREYPHKYAYRAANFILITFGCCCIYSLFNVVSIVIKQCLNSIIKRSDCRCGRSTQPPKATRVRRNALTPFQVGRSRAKAFKTYENSERRVSGELISLPDGRSKVSLAVMQKQLYETAINQKGGAALIPPKLHAPAFTPGKVGPVAIASTLIDENT